MRVISGKYRGRALVTAEGLNTRPTTDRVKESLFNILQWQISGARVLDLFAGSGGLGIECVSRGAEEVVFVDSSKASVDAINHNLRNMDCKGGVYQKDFEFALNVVKGKFDIIFIDAPYGKGLAEKAIGIIGEKGLLGADGVLTYEHAEQQTAADEIGGLIKYDERDYGKTAIAFYRVKTAE